MKNAYIDYETDPILPDNRQMKKGWRALITAPLTFLVRLLFRPEVKGLAHLPKDGAYIVVANHKNNWDPILISALIPLLPDWLSKEKLFQRPILAWLFYRLGMIPLDRKGQDSRAMRRMLNRLNDGRVLGIFPQGTRVTTREKSLAHPPKPGVLAIAKKRRLPLVVMAIEGQYRLFQPMTLHIFPPIDVTQALENYAGDTELAMQSLFNEIFEHVGETELCFDLGDGLSPDLPTQDRPTQDRPPQDRPTLGAVQNSVRPQDQAPQSLLHRWLKKD